MGASASTGAFSARDITVRAAAASAILRSLVSRDERYRKPWKAPSYRHRAHTYLRNRCYGRPRLAASQSTSLAAKLPTFANVDGTLHQGVGTWSKFAGSTPRDEGCVSLVPRGAGSVGGVVVGSYLVLGVSVRSVVGGDTFLGRASGKGGRGEGAPTPAGLDSNSS